MKSRYLFQTVNDSEESLKHNPFKKLGKRLKGKAELRPAPAKGSAPKPGSPAEAEEEKGAFLKAMRGVEPLPEDRHARKTAAVGRLSRRKAAEPDDGVMDHLENLVKTGEGFVISNTPEYMEGTGRDVPPEFAERLHRGDFSIQAHIDLHGMGVAQAKEVFEDFLTEAITSGKRAVLVIHGRGLSSPGEPILKNKVREWLTRSHWRKWVIAFTSAQSYDGGAGATYILLRSRRGRNKAV